jgi:hypothetical protein
MQSEKERERREEEEEIAKEGEAEIYMQIKQLTTSDVIPERSSKEVVRFMMPHASRPTTLSRPTEDDVCLDGPTQH